MLANPDIVRRLKSGGRDMAGRWRGGTAAQKWVLRLTAVPLMTGDASGASIVEVSVFAVPDEVGPTA